MERRDVLKSVGGIAAASTVALAGCSGGGCGTPSDGLEGALPEGGDGINMSGSPQSMGGFGRGLEGSSFAFYSGSDGSYAFGVAEFSSSDLPERSGEMMSQSISGQGGVVGRIKVDNYLYFAAGPDEASLKEFMATAPPLNSDCVDSSLELV